MVLLLPLTVVALLPDLASTTLCHSLWQRSSRLSLCYYRIRILFNERSEFVNFISNSIFWLSEKDSYVMLVQPLGSCLSRSWIVDPVFWGFMMYFWFNKLCSSVSSVVFTLLFVSPGLSLLAFKFRLLFLPLSSPSTRPLPLAVCRVCKVTPCIILSG